MVQSRDVRDEASVMMFMGSFQETLGLTDILVNCAGIGCSKPFVETRFEDFDNVVKTDLYEKRSSSAASSCAAVRESLAARSSTSPLSTRRSPVGETPACARTIRKRGLRRCHASRGATCRLPCF
ncbi:SDR family oxidoreductase [Rhizobium sp. CRRU65]|uniref:SDR family oxidoreductase n=1 Tax=Rhizobium sp. CRRU65 TaxID=3399566 RepID=UPI003AF82B36